MPDPRPPSRPLRSLAAVAVIAATTAVGAFGINAALAVPPANSLTVSDTTPAATGVTYTATLNGSTCTAGSEALYNRVDITLPGGSGLGNASMSATYDGSAWASYNPVTSGTTMRLQLDTSPAPGVAVFTITGVTNTATPSPSYSVDVDLSGNDELAGPVSCTATLTTSSTPGSSTPGSSVPGSSTPSSTTTTTATSTTTSTSTTSTTAAPTTSSTVPTGPQPVPTPEGPLPELAPGEALLMIDGVPTPADVAPNAAGTALVVSTDDFSLAIGATDASGNVLPLAGDGNVQVPAGGKTTVVADELEPSSPVNGWLFSDPQYLGATNVAGSGTAAGAMTIATGTSLGAHTVQFNGTTVTDQVRSISLGIRVAAAAVPATTTTTRAAAGANNSSGSLPVTGTTLALLPVGLVLLGAGGAVLVTRRRRHADR